MDAFELIRNPPGIDKLDDRILKLHSDWLDGKVSVRVLDLYHKKYAKCGDWRACFLVDMMRNYDPELAEEELSFALDEGIDPIRIADLFNDISNKLWELGYKSGVVSSLDYRP